MDILTSVFTFFNGLFASGSWPAMIAAFGWGVLSIILSPCHLSGIPLAIGFINGRGKMPTSRAFFLSALFALGILITIGVIGLITGLAGRMLGDIGRTGIILVSVLFVLMGIWLLDIIPLPAFKNIDPGMRGRGGPGAFILGLIFGLALGPCSFGFMMPLLLLVFREAGRNPVYAVLLLVSFALGHTLTIVLAGTFVNTVQKYLDWTGKSKGVSIFRKICGVLVMLGGIYLFVSQVK